MPEKDVVAATSAPVTVSSLVSDLRALGVAEGMTLLVHSALSKLGWVAGGAQAVVLALEEALGPDGTLVMPSFSTSLTEPLHWENPPVPETWWETIRAETPAYDPAFTPTREMGSIADTFRAQPGTVRGDHPHVSFSARGPRAREIVCDHALQAGLGEGSPLSRVYDRDGWILLLGVNHANNTSLHLCEYRASYPSKKMTRQGAPVLVDGKRMWVEFEDLDWDDEDFPKLGADYEREMKAARVGRVGIGESRLTPQRPLVDYGVQWLERNRRV